MNLLIVDDEYYIVQGLISAVDAEALGIQSVFAAYSSDQAKGIICQKKVDILITDIEMPKGSGLSLIEWVQEQHYQILSLVLTGHQRFDYAHRAISMHCFSYLLKPVDRSSLNRELAKAIASLSPRQPYQLPDGEPGRPCQDREYPGRVERESAPEGGFTEKVRNFIQENLSSPDLNRNSIAAYIHMNPDYLSSLFHSKFGQTLSAYITQARLDKAKELLLHSADSLNEISEKTGFSNSSYFCKQFKKSTGLTPQQYRQGKSGMAAELPDPKIG